MHRHQPGNRQQKEKKAAAGRNRNDFLTTGRYRMVRDTMQGIDVPRSPKYSFLLYRSSRQYQCSGVSLVSFTPIFSRCRRATSSSRCFGKRYTFISYFLLNMRGRSIPLTSLYSLEIRNDSVISYLPYYGRAYSIPYGGATDFIAAIPTVWDESIVLDGKMGEYIVTARRKGDVPSRWYLHSPPSGRRGG